MHLSNNQNNDYPQWVRITSVLINHLCFPGLIIASYYGVEIPIYITTIAGIIALHSASHVSGLYSQNDLPLIVLIKNCLLSHYGHSTEIETSKRV